eukprot:2335409-Rhodomonas_salina.3
MNFPSGDSRIRDDATSNSKSCTAAASAGSCVTAGKFTGFGASAGDQDLDELDPRFVFLVLSQRLLFLSPSAVCVSQPAALQLEP